MVYALLFNEELSEVDMRYIINCYPGHIRELIKKYK